MPGDLRGRDVVVGSGPNGLAAALTLAQAGRPVTVVEAADTVGGGVRSAELTLPGFVHDICSAVHPLALASPFLSGLPLDAYGMELVQPRTPLAHPLGGDDAVLLHRDLDATAGSVGEPDAGAYRRLVGPLVRDAGRLMPGVLGPPLRVPRHPVVMARFGLRGVWPARTLARRLFDDERARALLAGNAAHSVLPLTKPLTAAFGLLLMVGGHAVGWPVVRGGSQRLADALADHLRGLGGEVVTGHEVTDVDELHAATSVLLDVTPRQLVAMAAHRLPSGYVSALRGFRYGPGVFKVDYALDGPVPWRSPETRDAGTVHLGGTFDEIARSEADVAAGRLPERPSVLLSQPTVCDPSRAPRGKHVLWAYCHVPAYCTEDVTARLEAQIERYAPGFRDLVLARAVTTPADLEARNANDVGGAITGGAQDLRQTLLRPVPRLSPYTTPNPRLFLCSSSTPPGGGVHGMCGYHAARAVLRRCPG